MEVGAQLLDPVIETLDHPVFVEPDRQLKHGRLPTGPNSISEEGDVQYDGASRSPNGYLADEPLDIERQRLIVDPGTAFTYALHWIPTLCNEANL